MYETTGTYLDYELAYRVERLQGHRAPRRAEHPKPPNSRFGLKGSTRRRTR
jgi:hypothetical protein